jgi:hypothetical protein
MNSQIGEVGDPEYDTPDYRRFLKESEMTQPLPSGLWVSVDESSMSSSLRVGRFEGEAVEKTQSEVGELSRRGVTRNEVSKHLRGLDFSRIPGGGRGGSWNGLWR